MIHYNIGTCVVCTSIINSFLLLWLILVLSQKNIKYSRAWNRHWPNGSFYIDLSLKKEVDAFARFRKEISANLKYRIVTLLEYPQIFWISLSDRFLVGGIFCSYHSGISKRDVLQSWHFASTHLFPLSFMLDVFSISNSFKVVSFHGSDIPHFTPSDRYREALSWLYIQ